LNHEILRPCEHLGGLAQALIGGAAAPGENQRWIESGCDHRRLPLAVAAGTTEPGVPARAAKRK
jgi:hypothetical protein